MINQFKRLFGIKSTEAKIELAPVQEVVVTTVSEPEVIVESIAKPVPVPAAIVEPEVIVESIAEPVIVATVAEPIVEEIKPVKKPSTRKSKAKKTTK